MMEQPQTWAARLQQSCRDLAAEIAKREPDQILLEVYLERFALVVQAQLVCEQMHPQKQPDQAEALREKVLEHATR